VGFAGLLPAVIPANAGIQTLQRHPAATSALLQPRAGDVPARPQTAISDPAPQLRYRRVPQPGAPPPPRCCNAA